MHPAAHMQGYLSRDGLPPAELLAAGRREIREYGVALIDGTATAVNGTAEVGFTVQIAGREPVVARRVLHATGGKDVLPDVPGLANRWGRNDVLDDVAGEQLSARGIGVVEGSSAAIAINADLVAEEVARDVAILRARGAPPGRRSPASL